jgi:hypothetical protein
MQTEGNNEEADLSNAVLPEKHQNTPSRLKVGIILLIAVLAVAGLYLLKDRYYAERISYPDTSGWKEYQSETFGFEFKYPSDYYLTGLGELYSHPKIDELNVGMDRNTQWIGVGFSFAASIDAVYAEDRMNADVDKDFRNVGESSLEKILMINDKKVQVLIHPNYPSENEHRLSAHFYDSQYNSIYIGLDSVGESLEEARNSDLNKVFMQILSTVKFQKISHPAPNFEQDLFKKYGFIMDIPNSWENYRMSENVTSRLSSICFSFDGYCIMQIIMFTPKQYSDFIVEYPSGAEAIDHKNDKYYYYIDNVPECFELSEFECERTKEVPEMKKTFRFQ